MAGHSKWANIRHKKQRADARRGRLFSRLSKEIMVAAKLGGGDPDTNPRLRAAIERAKGENLPAENIERAIKRGTGELEGVSYEEGIYEGYAPGGVAVLVRYLTDNRNRTLSEVRGVFSKCGGRMGESGSVSWLFEKKGFFTFDIDEVDEDTLTEVSIEGGAEDIKKNTEDGVFEVYTAPEDFAALKRAFDEKGLNYSVAEVSMIPRNTVRVEGDRARKVIRLVEELEDLDDVQEVYANFDMPSEEMEKVA